MISKELLKFHRDFLPHTCTVEEDLYFCLLEKYINNREVNNIALTGEYGAGKSSVIESYIFKDKKKNTCKVSLAKYNTNIGENEFNDKNICTEETKNKTRYKYNQSNENQYKNVYEEIIKQVFLKVPQKKVLRSEFNYLHSKTDVFFFVVKIILIVLILLLIFSNSLNIMSLISADHIIWIKIIYAIVITIVLCISIYRIVDKGLIDSLKFNNISLDFKLYNENSNLLDKYLSEIIYIFKKSDIRVVFFEDLDRYNDINIFVELKELNKAVNLALNKYDISVTFVYAIRESIFANPYDKFKLFDASISIVPYASVYNAFDLLKKELINVEKECKVRISDEIINALSYYVQEYRAVIAVINDFVIFYNRLKNQLKDININVENLLYIITYKNIFSTDFAKIYKHNALINRVLETIKDNEEYSTLNEVYQFTAKDFSNRNEVINKVKPLLKINEKDKNENDLFIFVMNGIFEGYINDSFGDYVSYIYTESISVNDYNYISYVRSNNVKDSNIYKYDYIIKEPEKVYDRLHDSYFTSDKILNYCLIKYISYNDNIIDRFKNKVEKMERPIIESIKKGSVFLNNCLIDNKDNYWVTEYIFNTDEKICELMYECSKNCNKYLIVFNALFINIEISVLKMIDNMLSAKQISIKYIINNIDSEELFNGVYENKIISLINGLGIVFNDVSKYNFSEKVIESIFKDNKYIINKENIVYYKKHVEKLELPDDELLSLKEIIKSPTIKSYIYLTKDNFMIYFDNVWMKKDSYKEDDNSFVELVKGLAGDIDRLQLMYDSIEIKIKDLNTRQNMSIVDGLIERNKIEINTNNLQFIANYKKQYMINIVNDNFDAILMLDINKPEFQNLNKQILTYINNSDDKIDFLLLAANSLGSDAVVKELTSIDSNLIKDFNEKSEIFIDKRSEKFAEILEKVSYIKVADDRRRTCFMKIERL